MTTNENKVNIAYKEAYLQSERDMERLGINDTPPKPKGYSGYLPEGISNAPMHEITDEMEKMTAFVQYVQALGVDAKNQLRTAEETMKDCKASIRKRKVGAKDVKDDLTITDPEYVQANAEYLRKLYSYEKITAREEMARRDIKFLSRLITANEVDNGTKKQFNTGKAISNGKRRWR